MRQHSQRCGQSSACVLMYIDILEGRPYVLGIVPCAPPNAKHLDRQTADHHFRAGIGTGILIPGPLLSRPYRIYENRVKPTSPEQKRCCPRDVRIKLVMQASGTQHANSHRRQDSRHDKARCDTAGDLALDLSWERFEDTSKELRQRKPRRASPARQ